MTKNKHFKRELNIFCEIIVEFTHFGDYTVTHCFYDIG